MSLQEEVAANLRGLMFRKHLTAREISKHTGISTNTLSLMKRGENKAVQYKTLEKLCDYFEIPVSELFIQETKKSS